MRYLNIGDPVAFGFKTPPHLVEAVERALRDGHNGYGPSAGIAAAREAVAADHTANGWPISADRVFVTAGTSEGIDLALTALLDADGEVLLPQPTYPLYTAVLAKIGARARFYRTLPEREWIPDLDHLGTLVTPATRAVIVIDPNNPTGGCYPTSVRQALLAFAERHGLAILADEVYERLYFDPTPNGCAPSFLDIASPQDRLLVVHSFSKSFLMTGWRLGWLVMPPSMTLHMGKLVEFNTSCAPVFVQRAGQVAIERTADITPRVVQHLKTCRDTLVPLLQAVPGVQAAPAKGGMYAFFRLEDQARFGDSLETARRLVAEAGLGLAPGNAFMVNPEPEAQGWLRWCFASQDLARLGQGVDRLRRWLRA